MNVSNEHFDEAVERVVDKIDGINALYPSQKDLILVLLNGNNVFYTAPVKHCHLSCYPM